MCSCLLAAFKALPRVSKEDKMEEICDGVLGLLPSTCRKPFPSIFWDFCQTSRVTRHKVVIFVSRSCCWCVAQQWFSAGGVSILTVLPDHKVTNDVCFRKSQNIYVLECLKKNRETAHKAANPTFVFTTLQWRNSAVRHQFHSWAAVLVRELS